MSHMSHRTRLGSVSREVIEEERVTQAPPRPGAGDEFTRMFSQVNTNSLLLNISVTKGGSYPSF